MPFSGGDTEFSLDMGPVLTKGSSCGSALPTPSTNVSIHLNVSESSPSVRYCDYLGIAITGGQSDYILMVVDMVIDSSLDGFPGNGTVTNITLGGSNNALLLPNTHTTAAQVIRKS